MGRLHWEGGREASGVSLIRRQQLRCDCSVQRVQCVPSGPAVRWLGVLSGVSTTTVPVRTVSSESSTVSPAPALAAADLLCVSIVVRSGRFI